MAAHILIPPRHLLILFLFAALLLLPAVLFGAGGFDLLISCSRVKLFANQFWHGDLYPRWLQDMNAGNGSPLFFYYPPLAYFITSFFIFLLPLDPFGFYPIAASIGLAAFVAGIAFYLWMKEENQNNSAALIGSLLFMGAPDIIGLDFNYSMLFPSVWAYAWLPLLMLFAKRMALGRPYGVTGFALALAALIMTNIPTTIMFGPLAAAYNLLHCRREQIVRRLAALGAGIMLGFGLSAVFLIPAVAYLDYSLGRMIWSTPQTDYHHYLVILGFGALNQTVYTSAILLMAALTLVYWAALRKRTGIHSFFVLVSLASLFMITQQSAWVWKLIPVLKILQFPERFFMMPSLCLAVLASVTLPRLRWLAYALIAIYTACVFTLGTLDTRVTEQGLRKYDHMKYEKFVLNIDYPGYLTSLDLVPQYYSPFGLAKLDNAHDKIEVPSGDAATEIKQSHPRDTIFHYKATRPSTLRVRQLYFPGTLAFEGETMLGTSRDEDTGRILIDVPPGEGDVRLELSALLPEIAGKMISFICAGILLLGFLVESRRRGISAGPVP